MVFDARKARALAAGEHIIIESAPGLRLKATETKRTWTYRYKSPADGRMRQIAIGQWPAMSLPAALGEWEALRARRDAGQDPQMSKREAAQAERETAERLKLELRHGPYTVRSIIDDYIEGYVKLNRKPKGYAEMRRLMVNYTTAIHDILPSEFRRRDAFDLIEQLAVRAPVLANSLRTELGSAWAYALDSGRIDEATPNYWRDVLRGKIKSKGKIVDGKHQGRVFRALDDVEVATLLGWLPNFTALIEDILTMYLWTGTRGAEIVAMRGDEISEEADGLWWTIPREKTKMARVEHATDLRVPLVGRAMALVKRRKALHGDGSLFPVRYSNCAAPHIEQKVVGVALWEVRPTVVNSRLPADRQKVLRIKPFAPHDLRRTVRTRLSALGCDSAVAEAIIGHLPSGVEGIYNRHAYDNERRIWLTRLSEHWESLLH